MTDPYNLYFTPDGRQAIVVAERESRLDLRDPKSWRLRRSIPIPFAGVDHLDFWANGSYLLASAEFSGAVVGVVLRRMRVTGMAQVGGQPVDVELARDSRRFYVANQMRGGGSAATPTCSSSPLTAASFWVRNRFDGTVSVLDARNGKACSRRSPWA